MEQGSRSAKEVLRLDDRLIEIVEAEYPRFSEEEMARPRRAMATAMGEAGVDHPSPMVRDSGAGRSPGCRAGW
jgi:hypothetical protein